MILLVTPTCIFVVIPLIFYAWMIVGEVDLLYHWVYCQITEISDPDDLTRLM